MAEIARIEVFVDGKPEPFQVLTQAPFTLHLSPDQFAPGEHHLTVEVFYNNGDYHTYVYAFTVQEQNEVFVGYLNRTPIGAPLQVHLIDPAEATIAATKPSLFIHGLLPVLLFVLIAGVATWFSYVGDRAVSDKVTTVEALAPAEGSQSSSAASAGNGAHDGQALYAQYCTACHGPQGQGQADVFPALAGNEALADTEMVLDVVLHGRSGTAMPAWGEQLSDEEIAAVINYIFHAWGNDFGQVTPEDVAAHR